MEMYFRVRTKADLAVYVCVVLAQCISTSAVRQKPVSLMCA